MQTSVCNKKTAPSTGVAKRHRTARLLSHKHAALQRSIRPALTRLGLDLGLDGVGAVQGQHVQRHRVARQCLAHHFKAQLLRGADASECAFAQGAGIKRFHQVRRPSQLPLHSSLLGLCTFLADFAEGYY